MRICSFIGMFLISASISHASGVAKGNKKNARIPSSRNTAFEADGSYEKRSAGSREVHDKIADRLFTLAVSAGFKPRIVGNDKVVSTGAISCSITPNGGSSPEDIECGKPIPKGDKDPIFLLATAGAESWMGMGNRTVSVTDITCTRESERGASCVIKFPASVTDGAE